MVVSEQVGVLTVGGERIVLRGRALRIAALLARDQDVINAAPMARVYYDCGLRLDDIKPGIDARLPPLE